MDHEGFHERAKKGARAENVAMGSTTKAGAMGPVVDVTPACREHDVAGLQGGRACHLEVRRILLDYVDRA